MEGALNNYLIGLFHMFFFHIYNVYGDKYMIVNDDGSYFNYFII